MFLSPHRSGRNVLVRHRLLTFVIASCLAVQLLYLTIATLAAVSQEVPGSSSTVFVNEIHYDNAGTNANEFIEIAGPAGTDLSNYSIVLYNGSGGAPYDTRVLSGVIPDQQSGYGTIAFTYPSNGIQNGSPDGLALAQGSILIQFLSYEGTFTAVGGPAGGQTSTDIGVAEAGTEPVGQSLQLRGTGDNYGDFTWTGPITATPGAVNTGQTFSGVPPSPTPTPSPTPSPTPTPTPTEASVNEIQGTSHTSPLVGRQVSNVRGIVTAVRPIGFYIQGTSDDLNDATSEGIFVFTVTAPVLDGGGSVPVAVGDAVTVRGRVEEFRPGGSDGINNLSITQIAVRTRDADNGITRKSQGNAVLPTIIGRGGRIPPPIVISNDSDTDNGDNGNVEDTDTIFDPAEDGIDFYESLEGMLVQINNAVTVGPTNASGLGGNEIAVLVDNGADAVLRTPRGGIVIRPNDFNPERIIIDDTITANPPMVNVGDTLPSAIRGVIDYSFGNFKFFNIAPLPAPIPSNLEREVTTLAGATDQLTVATFNVENLDPGDGERINETARIIVNNLRAPDILALQEIQDNNGRINDAVVDASVTYNTLINAIVGVGGPRYDYRQIDPVDDQDGGELGGNIRVGFLFRTDRSGLRFVDKPGGGPTIPNSVNPDGSLAQSPGRIDPNNPAFSGDDTPTYPRTRSRKPLAGEFTFNNRRVILIANHFNAKIGDGPLFGRFQPPLLITEPQRIEQTRIVNNFVDQILARDASANVIVLGDLNEFQFSRPLQELEGEDEALSNLTETLPEEERYTFNFEGNAQALDHILVSRNLFVSALPQYDVTHVNSEYINRTSEHDPSVARFTLAGAPPTDPIRVALSRDAGGQLQATVTITNPLSDPVPGVTLTLVRASTLDGSQFVDGVPVPQSFGTINPGQSVTATVTFPGTAGVPSGFNGLVRVNLSYTGGTYTETEQVITP